MCVNSFNVNVAEPTDVSNADGAAGHADAKSADSAVGHTDARSANGTAGPAT